MATVSSPITIPVGARPYSGNAGALTALVAQAFIDGVLPHVCARQLPELTTIVELLPPGAHVLRSLDDRCMQSWLVEGDGWRALVHRYRDDTGDVEVYASSADLAAAVAEDFEGRCPRQTEPDAVEVTLWTRPGDSRQHTVPAAPWPQVSRNYPNAVRDSIDALAKLTPGDDAGRIILFHGEPGTGKTSAVRALLHEWRSWASAHVVLDGRRFVNDAGYITEVITEDDDWAVVVIEDAGDIVSEENLLRGALSCLLNVGDGLAGLGTKALFVLTTNERVQAVNTALVRPGRCLANIEFTRFPRREAIEWLDGDRDVAPDGLTLAELYARTSATPTISNVVEPEHHGLYL